MFVFALDLFGYRLSTTLIVKLVAVRDRQWRDVRVGEASGVGSGVAGRPQSDAQAMAIICQMEH